MAERYRDELRKEIPEIDVVLGTSEVPEIVRGPGAAGAASRAGRSRAVPLPVYLYDDLTPRHLTTPSHYAYVKIAEGCNYKCAFCIIPRLRGRYRSRTAASIVREARALAARGVKELLLVSQDTTYFGIDRGERGALARLLRRAQRGGRPRVDPAALPLPDDGHGRHARRAIAECDKVCKYVDLPLQHASDPVLRRMRRPGHAPELRPARSQKIRSTIPGVTLRTTFIVGFPGETDARIRRASPVRPGDGVRSRRRVHLLARGRHRGRAR